MGKPLVGGIVLLAAAVGFGGGYVVGMVPLLQRHAQAVEMRDDLRSAMMRMEGLPPRPEGRSPIGS